MLSSAAARVDGTACQNDIPVYCPAITDGSIGDMVYFHSFKNPGLVLDIVEGEET